MGYSFGHSKFHSFIQSLIQCGTLPGCCKLLMTFYYRSVESTVSLRICVSVSVCNYLPTVSRYYAINAFYLMSSPAPVDPAKEVLEFTWLWFIDSIYGIVALIAQARRNLLLRLCSSTAYVRTNGCSFRPLRLIYHVSKCLTKWHFAEKLSTG